MGYLYEDINHSNYGGCAAKAVNNTGIGGVYGLMEKDCGIK